MVQAFPFLSFRRSSPKAVDLPIFSHQILAKNLYRLNSLKLNGNGLLAAGNEDGVIVIFNLFSEVDGPQQVRLLGFEAGGVSDLLWIDTETLAVGTTRGWLVVYSMKNEAVRVYPAVPFPNLSLVATQARFSEVSNVKAHGDGVSHISVENIDYCSTTQTLVSVGEGVGSIKVWKFTPEDGRLTPRPMPSETTAYHLPRFVKFTDNRSKIMVGYFQNAQVQLYSMQPWMLVNEHILGEDQDAITSSSGNAFLLHESGLLANLNLIRGLDFYDASTFVRKHSAVFPIHECNQGLATLRGGSYLACAASDGSIHIFQTHDASLALKLKIPGRAHQIDAIHASNCGNSEFLVASSCVEGKASVLTVWCYKKFNQTNKKQNTESDRSTIRLVILCIAISFASHFIASISPLVQQQILSRFTRDTNAHSPPKMTRLGSELVRDDSSDTTSQPDSKTSSIPTPTARSVAIRKAHTRPESEMSLEVIAL
ncbi:hypothetical protein GALMADRAFT_147508 [Galerina marginata CBS 339.88]|uniref:Anaphase-promoting complex subunit 4 WD40 domain-containing protein n=1 Tax=Galerina marginata (strain CBS 339.88) TaxID=685588 RepID=A0A067S7L5_GALM3|nr:hypothetical protein GALMADRAFT_147508 [Galerina marginata CBS 339.88]